MAVLNSENITRFCLTVEPNINSNGIWDEEKDPIKSYSLPVFEMQMFALFAITEAVHSILKRIGLPKLFSQIVGGAILSPDLLGGYKTFSNFLLPHEGRQVFETASLFGFMLYLFVTGVKIDVGIIPTVGKKAMAIGLLSLLAPLILGLPMTKLLGKYMKMNEKDTFQLMALTTVNIATSFQAIATFLHEFKLINSELGRLCVSSAIISDLIGVCFRFGFVTFMKENVSVGRAAIDATYTIGFLAVVTFIMRPAMLWVIRQTPEGKPVKSMYIYITIIMVFASGLLTDRMGQYVMFGPFFVGLAVPAGPPLGSSLVDMFDAFVSAVFVPLYASSSFLPISLTGASINQDEKLVRIANFFIILVTFVAKVAACLAPPWHCNMPFIDAFIIGLVMSCKGVPDLGGYFILKHAGAITEDMFAMSVIYLLVATGIVSILVNYLYDPARKYAGYQKRNIMDAKKNSELRILSCIYRPGDLPATINLLNATHPTQEERLCIYVIHLVELIGRDSPVFISHQMQKRSVSRRSYSKNVIMSFTHYACKNSDVVTANIFTAVSPANLMHEDICTMALNKQASFILLPFHQKWAVNGCVEPEENNRRELNCKVLETAPCSIGILIDHGHLGSLRSSYRVCMIFLGGKDDREALTLAKRMAKGSNTSLTVMRLIPKNDRGELDWETMLDSEELKDVKQNNNEGQHVRYLEEVVEDGSQTAEIVNTRLGEYDLVIAGRRYGISSPQTSGLAEWSEFPELGPLGDLLATRDRNIKGLILVVQQQQLTSCGAVGKETVGM